MKDMDDLGNKISEISAKLNCSIEAHLVESIISLFNQGVLVRRLHSPRMLIDKDNFTMSVEQAQSVRFEGREKIIQLQVENSELKRKLDLAKEIDTRVLSYLVDHFLMQVANSRKAGMSVEMAMQHFGVDMIKAEMERRNPTPLVQWATKYLTGIKEI